MSVARPGVLRPGDWVEYDGGEHQVLALAGTSVRLRSGGGAEQVVLASHLLASPGFSVVGHVEVAGLEPFGLLEALPEAALEAVDGTGWLPLLELSLPLTHGGKSS